MEKAQKRRDAKGNVVWVASGNVWRLIDRLRTVLNETVEIHGKGNFPTISARLIDIISCVREKLRQAGMPPKSVKLNGGAASHVASADDFSYADLDLIFPMEVENSDSFDKVR
ncbi:hypothetical protein GCK32_019415, partial [Trichostrongylus colubriformis]